MRSACLVCRQLAGLEAPLPGGLVYEGSHFVVAHGPPSMSTRGTLLVESKRHFLDYGEMRPAESRELARILKRLFPAMKKAAQATRVYAVALMDGAPHLHLWLVPKPKGGRIHGVQYLASEHPRLSVEAAEEAAWRIRRALTLRTR